MMVSHITAHQKKPKTTESKPLNQPYKDSKGLFVQQLEKSIFTPATT